MNILVLGGSNAGLHFGWAAQFQSLVPEHEVTNRFLGAVGSLYGLSRLLELERDDTPAPELLIFEYALNDIVLLDAGCAPMRLLQDTLAAVVDYCARRKIPLIFLCLEVRPTGRARVYSCTTRVKRLYAGVARRHGAFPCIMLEDVFGAVRREDFLDEHHLTAEASKSVANFLATTVASREIQVPTGAAAAGSAFEYVRATEARYEGPCRMIDVNATVFVGPFLEIARSGVSYWPGRGRVVGLMLRSTQASGVFRIDAGGRAARKNAQSKMREIVPKLILLYYSTARPRAKDDLEIAMPAQEAPLMRLRNDRTLLDGPSETPFSEQTLEINGVLYWRRRSLFHRCADALTAALGRRSRDAVGGSGARVPASADAAS